MLFHGSINVFFIIMNIIKDTISYIDVGWVYEKKEKTNYLLGLNLEDRLHENKYNDINQNICQYRQ